MTIICQCRKITDTDLKDAFDKIRAADPEARIDHKQAVKSALGEYECGGCVSVFKRAAEQYNQTGTIDLFKRHESDGAQSGLCSTAKSRDYLAKGIPDLRKPAIEGDGVTAEPA